eukprot:328289_1
MASANRLRILCLHGYKQYDSQFKNRTNALRKSLKNMVEFHYVTAPHKIPFDVHLKQQKELERKQNKSADNDNESKQTNNKLNQELSVKIKQLDYLPRARAWWRSSDDGTQYNGIEETLKFISNVIQNDGPFDGILGFSQGGVLLSMLCLMQKYPKYFEKTFNLSSDITKNSSQFKFAWIISGFLPRCNELKPLLNDIISENKEEDINKVIDNIPLLLVMGKTDQYISTENVLKVMSCFDKDNVTLVEHEGGHYIPSHKDVRDVYCTFLSKMQSG